MNYDQDPVVEEVRMVREKIMKEFDYNPHALGTFLADRERKRRHLKKPVKISRRRQTVLQG